MSPSRLPSSEPPPSSPTPLGTLRTGVVDLRILGRSLVHALLVGAVVGVSCAVFARALDLVQDVLLRRLVGYEPLRAAGEASWGAATIAFRPWLLLVLPALGAGAAGWIAWRFAPEVIGGGGDASIDAFHRHDGLVRTRVPFLKALASLLTLGAGGAGGREGPTMQIGGALASIVARAMRVTPRERRVLYVAGIAAGVSAVFRTPLGAALFATEVLYRDDFESDALVPAVLASVVSYSVAIPFAEPSHLFAHAPSYPFIVGHLPFYGLLALAEVVLGLAFLEGLALVRAASARMPGPAWMRPGWGGLALGLLCAPLLGMLGQRLGRPGAGLGILGGGYGAAQVAIVGADWLPSGWRGAQILLVLCALKLVASSLTVGSGGSAGDFAPSLALGGMLGGAFGRALALVTNDPRIDPGSFALVGMGTLFGAIAHVPLSSMVLVCELAGSYDLIVPLMFAEGIAFVMLRRRALYGSQLPDRSAREVPAPAQPGVRVRDASVGTAGFVVFRPHTPASTMLDAARDAEQQVFPVLDEKDTLVGIVPAEALRLLGTEPDLAAWVVAGDLRQEPVFARPGERASDALSRMVAADLRQLPVADEEGRVIAYVEERALVARLVEVDPSPKSLSTPHPPPAR